VKKDNLSLLEWYVNASTLLLLFVTDRQEANDKGKRSSMKWYKALNEWALPIHKDKNN